MIAPRRIRWTFQSTPPSREATLPCNHVTIHFQISIHASLAGGDVDYRSAIRVAMKFQSTPPSREATACASCGCRPSGYFNPRLPRGRRLSRETLQTAALAGYFNPRLPRGRRPSAGRIAATTSAISIHASLAGGDEQGADIIQNLPNFNPRLPRGRRRQPIRIRLCQRHFNPRLPRGRRRH